ncbi:mucin-3B-like [Haliotis cracherodii]|uniref:mucin-3B-like n=1 Tax=Haliotis cracherodii TaxID=6455 RepID=UPI0039EAABAB
MIPQHSTSYLCALLLYPCLSYTVSGEDACPCVTGSNCPENCTLVNIAPQQRSTFTSRDNSAYTITGQAAWVTDGVTSGLCASVSSIYPVWKAEFGQNRTVSTIKIFWEGPQKDVSVTVGGRVCHSENISYTWMSEYTLVCYVPVTGDNLLMHRQPTGQSLNLSLCEVEIYALPTTSSFVSTTSLRSTTSSTTSGTSTTSAVSEKISTVASTDTFTQTKTTPIDLPTTEPKTSSTGTNTGPGTAKDDVSSIITPIMVSSVAIVVVLCVTVVIICYIRRQQGPNHKEENKNQSERHYSGFESGRGDGDYSSLNCAYEEFPNTLPDPAPPNTTDSTGHSLYANEGIESQMRDFNPDRVVYANGAVQME